MSDLAERGVYPEGRRGSALELTFFSASLA